MSKATESRSAGRMVGRSIAAGMTIAWIAGGSLHGAGDIARRCTGPATAGACGGRPGLAQAAVTLRAVMLVQGVALFPGRRLHILAWRCGGCRGSAISRGPGFRSRPLASPGRLRPWLNPPVRRNQRIIIGRPRSPGEGAQPNRVCRLADITENADAIAMMPVNNGRTGHPGQSHRIDYIA
ncbi:hypothetical protein [Paracraurococcus lichenis]|uniref:Uncharacterized protein n=1 Tax=Paracraurococcus lichenis TaxID=3064888 RepID=A0ABT9DZD5_9PROT|nr:hypothetical protein [Paracraurococcus sp. LOR1-02]MDO9709267.1 hypothetical protein [Paracraurococcus sp. LOR1-02]